MAAWPELRRQLDWIAVGTFAGLAGELADLGGGRRDEETAQDPFLR